MQTTELDTRGLNCPLPVLKAQKAIRMLPAGEMLRVLATDPKAPADFAAWCEAAGHALVASEADTHHHVLVIRKGG